MKHTKKLFSALLALVMIFIIAVPAFAAEKGSITINTTITNEDTPSEYKIYKIFDLVTFDAQNDHYSYSIPSNSPWLDFITNGIGKDYVLVDNTTDANAEHFTVKWNVDKNTTLYAAEFAKYAIDYAKTESINADATKSTTGTGEQSVVFNNLELGYYLVESNVGILCALRTTDKDAVITAKNQPTVTTKEVQEDSNNRYGDKNNVDTMQTVNFRSTLEIRGGAVNYVLHDKMTDGLKFDPNSVKVYLNGEAPENLLVNGILETTAVNYNVNKAVETKYEVVYPVTCDKGLGCTFHVKFKNEYLRSLDNQAVDEIVVLYQAQLLKTAQIADPWTQDNLLGEENMSKLSYGKESTLTTEWDKTTTYTYYVNIFKYEQITTTEQKPLEGVEFALFRNESGVTKVATFDKVYKEGTETVDYYVVTGWDGTKDGDTSKLVTGADGYIRIKGLDATSYYFEETKELPGYNPYPGKIAFTVTNDGYIQYGISANNQTANKLDIRNNPGNKLPETGGMGTTLFYVAGAILTIGAMVTLIVKRRMGEEE